MKKLIPAIITSLLIVSVANAKIIHFKITTSYGTNDYKVPGFRVSESNENIIFSIKTSALADWHKSQFNFSEKQMQKFYRDAGHNNYPQGLEHNFDNMTYKGNVYHNCKPFINRNNFTITCPKSVRLAAQTSTN